MSNALDAAMWMGDVATFTDKTMSLRGIDNFTGIQIFEDNHFGWESYQYFYPASKSKRIRRKCAKKYRRQIQKPVAYRMPWGIVANRAFINELKTYVKR